MHIPIFRTYGFAIAWRMHAYQWRHDFRTWSISASLTEL